MKMDDKGGSLPPPLKIQLQLDVPFELCYDLKTGAICQMKGVVLAGHPDDPVEVPVEVSLTAEASKSLIVSIDRLLRHTRDILSAAGDGSPSGETH